MNKKNDPLYKDLYKKWSDLQKEQQQKLLEKHKDALKHISDNSKQYAIGAMGGLMLLTASPHLQLESGKALEHQQKLNRNLFLVSELDPLLPNDVRDLNDEEKKVITQKLENFYNVPVRAEIDGKRLNRTYGYIGAEQHLMRYPGDNVAVHFESTDEAAEYADSGLAPGRGAWGYFTDSRESMTQKDIDREKYYIAVQTFLIPDYSSRVAEYRDFFKFRKMIVVNPHNGRAVVVVVGDVGPAKWTGKHLGGSPEVMDYLERYDGGQKGPVLYFFIDDPEDKVPLGPLE